MESESRNHAVLPRIFTLDTTNCRFDCNPSWNIDGSCYGSCFKICPTVCKILVVQDNLFTEPPPPPHMVPNVNDEAHKHLIISIMTITGCMLSAALLFCILCTVFKIYYSRRRNSRRMESTRMIFDTQNSFPDGDQGYVVDHPIWYINTVGLQQSVIESIAVFKYNKDEGLIEGTDCSVCLNEFEEDESLRLLPKCNHAFHLPCIDTWLRSHKNCPLCRAPILCENFDGQAVSLVPMGADLSSPEESQIETSVNHGGLISNPAVEDGTSEARSGDDNVVALPHVDESVVENLKMGSSHNVLRSHSRMLSDFVGTREATEPEMQPLRRSVSLDSSAAAAVYSSVANIVPAKQANLDTQVEHLKNLKSKRVSKRGSSGSSSFRKLIKSSSIGISLQKGLLSMKRSSSSSGKSSSSRYNRSRDSILPL
ncbi:hypothetical protein K2173_005268 [Erythroxylum novogranatense]|uniref:RING-type E3 ubiquitin transferase n=1 Tax=Erythroxylum novogranatense TaxID=1862640 RepID=A0AAV8TUQ4_9ROSI|nr:hypothetical protein K2173_005268 [Erythroxylum novogranatense]